MAQYSKHEKNHCNNKSVCTVSIILLGLFIKHKPFTSRQQTLLGRAVLQKKTKKKQLMIVIFGGQDRQTRFVETCRTVKNSAFFSLYCMYSKYKLFEPFFIEKCTLIVQVCQIVVCISLISLGQFVRLYEFHFF